MSSILIAYLTQLQQKLSQMRPFTEKRAIAPFSAATAVKLYRRSG
jgi:hypothetical protein